MRRSRILAGALALLATACASPAPRPMTHLVVGDLAGPKATLGFVTVVPGPLTSTEVERILRADLKRRLGERADDLDADVEDGRITLTGHVETLAIHDAAIDVARRMRGVVTVVDELRVDAPKRDDDVLVAEIERRMRETPATEPLEVDVSVDDGRVTLDGRVRSNQQVRLASTIARRVSGVTAVDNRLVHVIGPRDDEEIASDVEAALAYDLYLGDDDTSVSVDDGRVSITGTVGSLAERYRAEELAWVSGVQDVHVGGLEIDFDRERPYLGAAPTDLDDDEAARNVRRSMLYDPLVPHREIDVRVSEGVVTLTGIVSRYAAKEAAADAARQSRVARVVDNRIEVRPASSFADDYLAKTARRALDMVDAVEATDVQVEVVGGEATLRGTVDSVMERRAAITAVSEIAGITEVSSELETRSFHEPSTGTSDATIAQRVSAALDDDPWIVAAHVVVGVDQGEVTLTGIVADELSRRRAIENAHHAGARTVTARLAVHAPLTTNPRGS